MKYFSHIIFSLLIIFSMLSPAQQIPSDVKLALQRLINHSFIKPYIPNPSNRFDQVLGLPEHFGLEILHTHTFAFEPKNTLKAVDNDVDFKLRAIIQGILRTKTGRAIVRSLNQSDIKKINFHIHVVNSNSSYLDSWTDKNFNVHIFVSSRNFSEIKLNKVIIHELGQMVSGIDPAKVKNLADANFSDIEILKPLFGQLLESNRFLSIINTLRAFKLESTVLAELGENSNSAEAKPSCITFLKEIAYGYKNLHFNFDVEKMQLSEYVYRSEEIEKIDQLMSLLSDNESGNQFCEQLSTIEISQTPQKNSGSGPRPGIGSGDGP